MDKKRKSLIGLGLGVGAITLIGVLSYKYYKGVKDYEENEDYYETTAELREIEGKGYSRKNPFVVFKSNEKPISMGNVSTLLRPIEKQGNERQRFRVSGNLYSAD